LTLFLTCTYHFYLYLYLFFLYSLLFFLFLRPPPRPTLFPYTTLFRSAPFRLTPSRSLGHLSDAVASYCAKNRAVPLFGLEVRAIDRKSTRLNSSHVKISYAVFCLKKKRFITECFISLTPGLININNSH